MTVKSGDRQKLPRLLRQGAGFLISGLVALAVDAAMLAALTRIAGLAPLVARPIGIAVAMVAGWLSHRWLTFDVTTAPTVAEYLRYAAVAWIAAALNYAIFSAILMAYPALAPEAALVLSSIVAMIFSYVGMRFGVFPRHAARP